MTIRMKSTRPHRMAPYYYPPAGTVGTVIGETSPVGTVEGAAREMYIVDGWPLPINKKFVEVINP